MKMKKILNVESPRKHYVAKATIIWCFDARFDKALEKFMTMTPEYQFDVIKVAGGVKQIASPERETDRNFILDQIAASIRLHKSETVIIMSHNECGAYDGKTDIGFYLGELKKGEDILENRFAGKKIIKIFVDFDGIYEV